MYSAFAGETQRRKKLLRVHHWVSSQKIFLPSFDSELFQNLENACCLNSKIKQHFK